MALPEPITEPIGLIFIQNQPIIFNLDDESCRNYLDDGYCQIFEHLDHIRWQAERLPCGEDLFCDLSAETLGAELLVDPGFDSPPDWTALNGCVVAGSAAQFTGTASGTVYQTVGITGGRQYKVTFVIANYVSGILSVPGYGNVTANGTYSYTVSADPSAINLSFYAAAFTVNEFYGDITSASIKEISRCFTGDGWVYDETTGKFSHLPGLVAPYTPVATPLIITSTYKFIVTITDTVAGSFTIRAGDNISDAISGNGETIVYLYTGGSTTLEFTPTLDFDGNITVGILRMSEIRDIQLLDLDLFEVCSLLPFVSYHGNRIQLDFTYTDLINTYPELRFEQEACYKILIEDACDPQFAEIIENGTFTGGAGTTPAAPWYSAVPGNPEHDYTGNVLTFSFTTVDPAGLTDGYPAKNDITLNFSGPGNYRLTFDIVSSDPECQIYAHFEGVAGGAYYSGVGTHTLNLPNFNPGVDPLVVRFQARYTWGAPGTYSVSIDNASMEKLEPFSQNFVSNCIKITSALDCSKWVEATSDCEAFGFDFTAGFKLGLRVKMVRFNPAYPSRDNKYTKSSGLKQRTSAERDKRHEVKTDKMDEIAHDCMSAMLLSDTLLIDNEQYMLEEGEYQVIWNRTGRFSTAPARFLLSKITNPVVYNNSCGTCVTGSNPYSEAACLEICDTVLDTFDGGNEPAPGATAGLYAYGDGSIRYFNGAVAITEESCDSGLVRVTEDGTLSPGDVYVYDAASTSWLPYIQILTTSNTGYDYGVTAIIPNGSVARLQISTDGGTIWTDQGVYRTAPDWYTMDEQYTSPVDPPPPASSFLVRLIVSVGGCVYYSTEVTHNMV